MAKLIPLALALCSFMPAFAADPPEVYLKSDLTTMYLWRGQQNAGFSFQPVAGMRWAGFNLYAWGNVPLTTPAGETMKYEIDLFLKYSVTRNFTVGLKNVYVNTRGKGFLSYGSIPHAANGLDVTLAYDFKYVNAEWTTTIAGYDGYNHHGHRAYGSYLLINAPFSFAYFDWNASLGIVPYYCSRYSDDVSDGFHVNMCALKMGHTFKFDKVGISLTPYAQMMVNPSSRKAFFQFGANFTFDPSKRVVAEDDAE